MTFHCKELVQTWIRLAGFSQYCCIPKNSFYKVMNKWICLSTNKWMKEWISISKMMNEWMNDWMTPLRASSSSSTRNLAASWQNSPNSSTPDPSKIKTNYTFFYKIQSSWIRLNNFWKKSYKIEIIKNKICINEYLLLTY